MTINRRNKKRLPKVPISNHMSTNIYPISIYLNYLYNRGRCLQTPPRQRYTDPDLQRTLFVLNGISKKTEKHSFYSATIFTGCRSEYTWFQRPAVTTGAWGLVWSPQQWWQRSRSRLDSKTCSNIETKRNNQRRHHHQSSRHQLVTNLHGSGCWLDSILLAFVHQISL